MRERMERLDEFLKVKQLSDNQVTNMCGLSAGLLSKARAGKSDIGMAACNKILDKFGDLNRVWLLWGEGDMLNPSQMGDGATLSEVNATVLQRGTHFELKLENELLKAKIASLKNFNEQMDRQLSIMDKKLEVLHGGIALAVSIEVLCFIITIIIILFVD